MPTRAFTSPTAEFSHGLEGGEKVPEGRMRGFTASPHRVVGLVATLQSPSSGAARHLLPAFAGRSPESYRNSYSATSQGSWRASSHHSFIAAWLSSASQ